MPAAYVLMTAMPPTIGHDALIEFAYNLAPEIMVVLSVQPDEPFRQERETSLREHISQYYSSVAFTSHDEFVQQNPKDENDTAFWEMWATKLRGFGFRDGDYIVASEEYGIKLAESVNGVFIPFDPERTIVPVQAEHVRVNPWGNWDYVLPEFQKLIRPKVTIFGAESTGKSTLVSSFGIELSNFKTSPEWARTYLEMVGPELTVEKMTNIWLGQRALQRTVIELAAGTRAIMQDTDLFSTVGYWRNWDPKSCSDYLTMDAMTLQSDLYIITPSNIPFEQDPLRYGGDERELDDQYWIDICDEFDLNYVVLESVGEMARIDEADQHIQALFDTKVFQPLQYERERS